MTIFTECGTTDTAIETRYRDRTKRSAIVLTDCFTCGTSTTPTPEGQTDMTASRIKLWKDNRLDGEWEITLEVLATQFAASPWANYEWPLERSVAAFITDREGLCSAFDEDGFAAIREACYDAKYNRGPAMSPRPERRRPAVAE